MHGEARNEFFAHLAAEFINRESNRQSLITVTGTRASSDGKLITILVTVLPENKEEEALHFLLRSRDEFRTFAKGRLRGRTLPRFDFAIDLGEKNRQALDELSAKD